MLIIKKHLTLRPDLNPDFGPIAGTAEGGKSVSRRLYRGLVQQTLLIWLLSAVAALAVGATAYVTLRHSGNADSGPAERPFTASDFKWPTLIEHLNDGSLRDAVNTDEAVFILYYLKEMNAVFGDPDMKVFIDAQCFTKVFDAEMSARLQSMFWTKVMPKAVWELGALIKDDRAISESLASRYPILAGVVQDLARDVPTGTLDRLFILGNLPRILQAKARQDALTLFSSYGCASPVTRRIYSNSVAFVKAYGASVAR